jgi:predicted PurR-regulated permease PerM
MNYFKIPFYAKVSIITVGLYFFILILFETQSIIVPIIGSTIISILLSPIVDFLINKKFNSILSIALVITFFTAISILIAVLLSSQISNFVSALPKIIDKFYQTLNSSVLWSSHRFNVSEEVLNKFISDTKIKIINSSGSLIGSTIYSIGNVFFTLLLIPVYVFLLLFYKLLILDFIRNVFGKTNHIEVDKIINSTKVIIQRYLIAIMLEVVFIAVLNSVGLLIIGIDYAIVLGILCAFLNIIPYLGGLVSMIILMVVAFATKDSFSYSVYVMLVFLIIQFIDNNFLLPRLVASKVSINELISVIAIIVGGEIWGITGMFLSIPLVGIIKVICDNVTSLKPWGLLLGNTLPKTKIV